MDERAALRMLETTVEAAGDDAAVVGDVVLTIDMLHERTDFPTGTTRYTAGWRAVGASLSDVAAMGAVATATVAAYGAPSLAAGPLRAFVDGARTVSEAVGASYVGGDLDVHDEFTVATTAIGRSDAPVRRTGCAPGEAVLVTGELGRTAGALAAFDRGDPERGNELFRFQPRVEAGLAIGPSASAMMDISDGLARSLHQLAEVNACGFAIDWEAIPVHQAVTAGQDDPATIKADALGFGEDFELLCCVHPDDVSDVRSACPVPVVEIGSVTGPDEGITLDGEPLTDMGYTHGTEH